MVVQDLNNKMTRLSKDQLDNKINFIRNYISAENAATGSTFDANSNVVTKNVGDNVTVVGVPARILKQGAMLG